jgi:hypothetical protein
LACVPTIGGSQLKLWALLAADQIYGRVADVSVAPKGRSRLLVPEGLVLYDTHTWIPGRVRSSSAKRTQGGIWSCAVTNAEWLRECSGLLQNSTIQGCEEPLRDLSGVTDYCEDVNISTDISNPTCGSTTSP